MLFLPQFRTIIFWKQELGKEKLNENSRKETR